MTDLNDVIHKLEICTTLSDIDIKNFLDDEDGYAHVVAKSVKKELKTTQIRKFYGALKKMEEKTKWVEVETEFYLLKPRMAASVGRGILPRQFYRVIIAAMSKVDNVEDDEVKMKNLDVFIKFFEAIVAYHKFEEKSKRGRR